MQIGEVAHRTGLSINTIRHYDQAGLVTPSARSQGGFRLYTEEDVEQLLVIRRMKPLGFPLEQVRELLAVTALLTSGHRSNKDEEDRLRSTLNDYQRTAEAKRDQLAAELAYAEEFIATMRQLAPKTPVEG